MRYALFALLLLTACATEESVAPATALVSENKQENTVAPAPENTASTPTVTKIKGAEWLVGLAGRWYGLERKSGSEVVYYPCNSYSAGFEIETKNDGPELVVFQGSGEVKVPIEAIEFMNADDFKDGQDEVYKVHYYGLEDVEQCYITIIQSEPPVLQLKDFDYAVTGDRFVHEENINYFPKVEEPCEACFEDCEETAFQATNGRGRVIVSIVGDYELMFYPSPDTLGSPLILKKTGNTLDGIASLSLLLTDDNPNVTHFRCNGETEDHYKVHIDQTGTEYYLPKQAGIAFKDWPSYLKQSIGIKSTSAIELLLAPGDDNRITSTGLIDGIKIEKVVGDWIYVSYENQTKFTPTAGNPKGWMRWRKDNEMRIDLYWTI